MSFEQSKWDNTPSLISFPGMDSLPVKYRSGFLNSLFKDKVVVTTTKGSVICNINGVSTTINYLNFKDLIKEATFWGDKLIIVTDQTRLRINGLSKRDISRLHKDIIDRGSSLVASRLAQLDMNYDNPAKSIENLLNVDRYLSNYDIRRWIAAAYSGDHEHRFW